MNIRFCHLCGKRIDNQGDAVRITHHENAHSWSGRTLYWMHDRCHQYVNQAITKLIADSAAS